MRNLVYIFLLIPCFIFSQNGVGDFEIREATKKDIIICKHTHNYVPNYSPKKIRAEKRYKSNAATFIPTYVGVPDDFKAAIEFAFDAVGEFITSDIPIYVRVGYRSLDNGVLAQAGPGSFTRNFPGAAYYDTFYPIALAEKLAGRELNQPGAIDLSIDINSDEDDWNVIPDNPSIGNRFDLATTLMHEILHGLGFTAGSGLEAGMGTLASLAFSRFIESKDSLLLLDGFPQNSEAMGDQFTSGDLFFDVPNSNARYRLYAPSNYQSGSSISHLDRALFQGSGNRMMTPTADRGDINYNPGISENIMNTMGWNITSIVHDPELFSEDVSADYLVTAQVNSDIGFDTSSFVMHYSTDSFDDEDIVLSMDYDASKDEFSILLPATGAEIQYQYYFELDESGGQKRLVPARANELFFTYNFGQDDTAPVIAGHVPLTAINETDIEFTLKVNDINDFFTGVDTSSLVAVISLNENLDTIPFEIVEGEFGDFFEAIYQRPAAFEVTDELAYKIVINDKSSNTNEGSLPASGFFDITINEVSAAVVTYVNDFEAASLDFTGTGFSIRSEARFSGPAIHSDHPYTNAGEGSTLNYTYELNQLILIDEKNPIIKFDEVVIVEPGESGTTCVGADCPLEFWDYVIVEGKKVGGTRWLPLLDGYDSRDNSDFLSAYNNTQTGSSGLYRPKEISLIENGNFEIGDEMFIRFRLFSDPFAVGWGWAIDNLEIQPIGTSTLDGKYVETFELFPNPISNSQLLTLDIQLKEKFSGELILVNTNGQQLINNKINNRNKINVKWDLSELSAGVYYAQLKNVDGVSVRKIIVK